LYSRSIFFLQQQPMSAKLFENDKVSLTMNIAIQQAIQQTQQMEPPKTPQPPQQLDKE
jgi:hypothetical protein